MTTRPTPVESRTSALRNLDPAQRGVAPFVSLLPLDLATVSNDLSVAGGISSLVLSCSVRKQFAFTSMHRTCSLASYRVSFLTALCGPKASPSSRIPLMQTAVVPAGLRRRRPRPRCRVPDRAWLPPQPQVQHPQRCPPPRLHHRPQPFRLCHLRSLPQGPRRFPRRRVPPLPLRGRQNNNSKCILVLTWFSLFVCFFPTSPSFVCFSVGS